MNMFLSRLTRAAVLSCGLAGVALSLQLSDLTNQEAAGGIRGALPPALDDIAKGMRMRGRGKYELVAAMNASAEQAVPHARVLLSNAVKSMSIEDAKKILTGGDESVTQFFLDKTAAPLALKFLPIVKQSTNKVGLAQKYNQFAGQGAKLGLICGQLPGCSARLMVCIRTNAQWNLKSARIGRLARVARDLASGGSHCLLAARWSYWRASTVCLTLQ
jgi:Protein of unknown function (DUF4197)